MANPSYIIKEGDPTTWTPFPNAGYVYLGVNLAGQLCSMDSTGAVSIIGSAGLVGLNAQNVSGVAAAFNVAPLTPLWTERVNFSGSGRAIIGAIGIANVQAGWVLRLILNYANIASLDVTIASNAVNLAEFDTDGSQKNAVAEFHFEAGAWVLDSFLVNTHA